MRALLAVLIGCVLTGCSGGSGAVISGPVEVASDPPSSTKATMPSSAAESCEALARYFGGGGSSHDSGYVPAASVLYIYGLNGREYALTPDDGECIRNSAAVSAQVRDAVTASGEDLADSDLGALLPDLLVTANERAVTKGISILRNGSVRDVAEAEPPHGDSDANLNGLLGPHLVNATVRRTGDSMLMWEVVGRQSIAGVEVQTVRGSYTFLRFPYETFTVDVAVLEDGDLNRFLRDESIELVGAILCPSECGDLPDGADG